MSSFLRGNILEKAISGSSPNMNAIATETLPLPKKIVVPMQQHIGAPCCPAVEKKQKVQIGSVLGNVPHGERGAAIHSGVSGEVVSISDIRYVTGILTKAVVIETDGYQTVKEEIEPINVFDEATFFEAIANSGIVGLGGAGFPIEIKLKNALNSKVRILVINAAECEPLIASDNREMIECADDILEGIRLICTYLPIKYVYLGIEKNSSEAMRKMYDVIHRIPNGQMVELPEIYPQGAEKILVKSVTGKSVPRGKLPSDVGVLVMNVSTVSAIAKYIATGMPLTSRRLSVAGNAIKTPKNVMAIVGTPFADVLNFCGLQEEPNKIIMGGPMMGIAIPNDEYPVVKQNNGVFAFAGAAGIVPKQGICIRCGRCIEACPMGLSPVEISSAMDNESFEAVKGMMADMCISCGACSYVCPAKRHITQSVVQASIFCKKAGSAK